MNLLSRFFGRKDEQQHQPNPLIANPQIDKPPGMTVLFSGPLAFTNDALEKALRSFDRSMSSAICERDEQIQKEGYVFSLAGWGKHVIRLVGFNLPMPAEALEPCVAGAHYPAELKEQARNHQSHLILSYAGYEMDPMEQYVALACLAGTLSKFGGIVVVNEAARTSFPTAALAEGGNHKMELLHIMPLMYLYLGFVKYETENGRGVWMRTYGAHLFKLPDFSILAAGHHQAQQYLDMFSNVIQYLLDSKGNLLPGHTMQIDEEMFMRFRKPKLEEYFLDSEGQMLVVELINKSQINR